MRKCFFRARNCALLFALVAFPAALLSSCSGAAWRAQKLSDGSEIRWTPAEPKIGDLVTLEAIAGNASELEPSSGPVFDPSGLAIDPVAADFTGGLHAAKKIRWSFRVTASGPWTFGDGAKRQTLWNAATVAGKESELKKFDGESLWHGLKPKAAAGIAPAASASAAQGATP